MHGGGNLGSECDLRGHRQHCTAHPARSSAGTRGRAAAKHLTRKILQHQGHPQLLQGLHPKAAPKRKAGSVAEHHMEGGRKIRNQGKVQAKPPGNSFYLPASSTTPIKPLFKPLLCHHHSLKPFAWGKESVHILQPHQDISRKENLGLLLLFLKDLCPNIWALRAVTALLDPLPVPVTAPDPALTAPDPAPFPLGTKLYKGSAEPQTGVLEDSSSHSLCPGIKLRKQGRFSHFLLCWPLAGSVCRQHPIHPLDASLALSLHPSCDLRALQLNSEIQDVPHSLSLTLV